MKTDTLSREQGSVLLMVAITITILCMVCAVTLTTMQQDGTATTQTTSWQQALAGAEAAADVAMNALNTGQWNGWYNVSDSVPSTKPTGGSSTTSLPASNTYNYYIPSAMPLKGEASNAVNMWVTVDPGAGSSLIYNGQSYRIRATGVVSAPGPARVSNSKGDNDLRHIALLFDRLSGSSVSTPQAIRRIEIIAAPVNQNIWARGITLGKWITMSGGAYVDSFNSGDGTKSTGGQYDQAKRQSNGNMASVNSTGSNLNSTYVYGSIQYSGPAIANTKNVQGNISTPFNATLPTPVDPTTLTWWDSNHAGVQSQPPFMTAGSWSNYTNYSSGGVPATLPISGSASNPTFVKINGDFTVPAGKSLTVSPASGSSGEVYVTIWVTGKLTTSGSGLISQAPHTHVVWVVDSDITVSGGSFLNQTGYAGNMAIVGVGTSHKATVSGSGNFVGTINAPGFDVTVSGTGAYMGALIGNTLTISGGGGLHYDEALNNGAGGSSISNYTYASWFEDNSDPTRGVTY